MTPEERFERIERQLEFLAANQTQLSASVETLREVAVRHDSQIVQLADVVSSLVRIVEAQGRRTDERINLLEESQRRTDERINLLAESERRTDERLNTLINVVERYFSNGHKQ